jgi:hypothetical protein
MISNVLLVPSGPKHTATRQHFFGVPVFVPSGSFPCGAAQRKKLAVISKFPLSADVFELLVDDARVSDKYEPAGCIDVKEGALSVFGWAAE